MFGQKAVGLAHHLQRHQFMSFGTDTSHWQQLRCAPALSFERMSGGTVTTREAWLRIAGLF